MEELFEQAVLILIQNGAIGVVCGALMWNTWHVGKFHARALTAKDDTMDAERKENREELERARDSIMQVLDTTNKIDSELTHRIENNSSKLDAVKSELQDVVKSLDKMMNKIEMCPKR